MNSIKKLTDCRTPLGLIVIIALATALLDYFTPLMGDDMAKWIAMGADRTESFPERQAISFIGAQYFGCNGRVFDAFGPLIVNLLPPVLASALMGLMTGLFFYVMCLAADVFRRGRVTLACGFITVSMFTLPWWDSMFLRVCHFNYIWGSAFAILFIYVWFRDLHPKKFGLLLLFLLGIMAGCFHEQIGVALTAYFGLYVVIKRCRRPRLVSFAGLCLGTLITLASPSIWNRNSEFIQDAPRGELLLTTLPLVVILIIITAALYLGNSRLKAVVKSERYVAYLTIAVFSSAIAIYSSVPGRTGWLAESCALVALTMLCEAIDFKLSRRAAYCLIPVFYCLILAHFSTAIYWQYRMNREYDEAIDLFRNSDSGIVKMDYTNRLEPSPLTLYRVKGLPDGDDRYLKSVFQGHYGPGKTLTLITPESVVTDSLPRDFSLLSGTSHDTIMVCTSPAGQTLVINPFNENGATRYKIEPLIVDPGDKWHKVNS